MNSDTGMRSKDIIAGFEVYLQSGHSLRADTVIYTCMQKRPIIPRWVPVHHGNSCEEVKSLVNEITVLLNLCPVSPGAENINKTKKIDLRATPSSCGFLSLLTL